MKSLLLTLLLFCFAYSELTKYQKECEDYMNGDRIIIAAREKIANMNELKYDEELEKAAKIQKHNCSSYGVEEIIKNEMYSTHYAAYHPRATKVACIEYYCSNSNNNMKFYVIDKGPGGEKTGEPGSKCPSGRKRKAESGLCVVSSGFGVSKNIVLAVLIVILNFI